MSLQYISNEVLDHILSLLYSTSSRSEFLELRLVCWQFDSLASRIAFQHATQSELDIGRKTHWRASIEWMLATKAKIHVLDTQGPFAFLHDAVEYLLDNRVVPQFTVNNLIVAACRAIIAVHEPSWVVNHLVTWQSDKSLPQSISHLETYVRRRGHASWQTKSQNPEAFYGTLHLLLACGSEVATEIASIINGSPTLNATGLISCHAVFGDAMRTAIVLEEVVGMRTLVKHVDLNAIDIDGKRSNALVYAAEMNRKKAVCLLLKFSNSAQINARGRFGLTTLGWAARRGWIDVVQLLLQKDDIDVDIGNKRGETHLAAAAKKDYEDIAQLLIAKTSAVVGSTRSCPLRVAFESSATRVLRLFLDRFGDQIDINQEILNEDTPLIFAIKEGFTDLAQMLPEVPGVKPDQPDSENQLTPLAWAVKGGQIEIAWHLVNLDIDITRGAHNKLPAVMALEQGDLDMVDLLIHKTLTTYDRRCTELMLAPNSVRNRFLALQRLGQSAQFRKDYGFQFDAVLWNATRVGEASIVQEVLQYEDIDTNCNSVYSTTTLLNAAEGPASYDILKLLLTRTDVDVNARGPDGRTALMLVTSKADISSMEALMKYPRIDLNLDTPYSGSTMLKFVRSPLPKKRLYRSFRAWDGMAGKSAPLLIAAENNSFDAFELLFEDPRKNLYITDGFRRTALWWAVQSSSKRMVEKILDHTPRTRDIINTQDGAGWAPLHIAANSGDFEIARMLMGHPDIDPNVVIASGWTALHISMVTHAKTLSQLLLNHPKIDTSLKLKDGRTVFDFHEDCQCDLLSKFSQASL